MPRTDGGQWPLGSMERERRFRRVSARCFYFPGLLRIGDLLPSPIGRSSFERWSEFPSDLGGIPPKFGCLYFTPHPLKFSKFRLFLAPRLLSCRDVQDCVSFPPFFPFSIFDLVLWFWLVCCVWWDGLAALVGIACWFGFSSDLVSVFDFLSGLCFALDVVSVWRFGVHRSIGISNWFSMSNLLVKSLVWTFDI